MHKLQLGQVAFQTRLFQAFLLAKSRSINTRTGRKMLQHRTQNTLLAVFRIHGILVRIRIQGSGSLTNGSGSGSALSSVTYKKPKKTIFAYFFLNVYLRHSSKIKSTCSNQGFPTIFSWWWKDPNLDPELYLWPAIPDPEVQKLTDRGHCLPVQAFRK